MSEVKKRCQLNDCNRAASTYCFCCNKNVCTRHFAEHIDAVKAQIDPLANEINTMVEKIQGLTIEQLSEKPLCELRQWQIDMHQLIDEIFFAKCKEIEDLARKNQEKFVEHKKQQFEIIMKIQDDVKQLVEDGDATFEQIQLLKNQLASVETNLASFRNNFLAVNARVFAQGLVTVLSNLNKPSINQNQWTNQPQLGNLISMSTNAPPSCEFGLREPISTTSIFGTHPQQSASFSSPAGGFGPSLSQFPSSTIPTFHVGATPPTSSSPFGQELVFGTSTKNPLPFGNVQSNISFQFKKKTKKNSKS
ncbi:unnamed protein product [Rotaria sordida]|uniref:Uncharacterized protein n=3 Tax=Rotaria sordida TaxID=392033 RepID=A0A819TLE1_9BILA|nr:unnamed protein product [Rotaria sordida]